MELKKIAKHRITRKLPKELQELADSAIDHIGTMLDNMKFTDFIESLPYLLAMYWGFTLRIDTEKNIIPIDVRLRDMTTALIGLKLATTMGGTPPVSQIAGLSILGILGLSGLGENSFSTMVTSMKSQIDTLDISPEEKERRKQQIDDMTKDKAKWESLIGT